MDSDFNSHHKRRKSSQNKAMQKRNRMKRRRDSGFFQEDFRCAYCRTHITTDPFIAGVKNRNHCPYCLSSKHVDQKKAGDRLSACKAEMKPIGLTLKKIKKKYGPQNQGELMLIHRCSGCGKISINRIAADDDADKILEVFERSNDLDHETKTLLVEQGVHALQPVDIETVRTGLFGAGSVHNNDSDSEGSKPWEA
jgi:hypothetical protein